MILSTNIQIFSQLNPYLKERLSEKINSRYDEVLPMVSGDEKTIFFCRKQHPQNTGSLKKDDIWFSTINPDGTWSEAQNIGEPLNNEYSNAIFSISPDGNTLILGGDYIVDSQYVSCLYFSYKTAEGWTYPKQIKIDNFYYYGKYISCNISNDGQVLLLGLERSDTYGGQDIYVSFRKENNEFSEPMNLGDVVNTFDNETTPFLASDGKTLYFSSKGHEGFGDYDVFVTKRLDDTWLNWSKPENLGEFINTQYGDANYIITPSGNTAYFSSTYSSNNSWDLFKVSLPKKVKPNPVLVIYGKIVNPETNFPLAAKIFYHVSGDNNKISVARNNPVTGEFLITLPIGTKYVFSVLADSFMTNNNIVDAENIDEYLEMEYIFNLVRIPSNIDINNLPRDLDEIPLEMVQNIVINKLIVHFPYNTYPMPLEYEPGVNYIVNILKKYPDVKVKIEGHTDSIGSYQYNKNLSIKRAKSVVDFMISKGINKKRIQFFGYGHSKPKADNSTQYGRNLNRRVEFTILRQ